MRPFDFAINTGFSIFLIAQVILLDTLIAMLHVLELGTYSKCYCFMISIIILVRTFFVFYYVWNGLLSVLRK